MPAGAALFNLMGVVWSAASTAWEISKALVKVRSSSANSQHWIHRSEIPFTRQSWSI